MICSNTVVTQIALTQPRLTTPKLSLGIPATSVQVLKVTQASRWVLSSSLVFIIGHQWLIVAPANPRNDARHLELCTSLDCIQELSVRNLMPEDLISRKAKDIKVSDQARSSRWAQTKSDMFEADNEASWWLTTFIQCLWRIKPQYSLRVSAISARISKVIQNHRDGVCFLTFVFIIGD